MKKNIFTLLLFTSLFAAAQDTTTVDQYCDMIVTNAVFSNKVNIALDLGQEKPRRSKNYKLKDEVTGRLREFNTVVDALNYMGSIGWELINAFPFPNGESKIYHYYLKKRFKKSELVD